MLKISRWWEKDEERADRLIKDAEKERTYTGKTVEDLYVIAKKLGKGNTIAVVRIIDGGKTVTIRLISRVH